MGELYYQKPDGSMEKLCDGDIEPVELSLNEDNGEADRIFELWRDPLEISFTTKMDPMAGFYLATKFLGGEYWRGKVPRRRIKHDKRKNKRSNSSVETDSFL